MPQPKIIRLESLDDLLKLFEDWDDLWRRSDVTLPLLRAEILVQWVEQFSRPENFIAVAVEAGGRLAAALPLVRRKIGRFFPAAALPCNEWADSGDLLLDDNTDIKEVLDVLAAGIRNLNVPLLWLGEAALDANRWRLLCQALRRNGMTVAERRRWRVGRVEIDHDWPAFKARWSRKHRQQMTRAARRMEALGDVRLDLRRQLMPDEVETAMRECFQIENLGWKGVKGTSVLRTPKMAEFYIRQAESAACWGQLEIAVLRCGGQPAAFSYGLSAKGVFHSIKTGYDPEFSEFHPGQLLRYHLLERFFADHERKALDFQGPINEAHAAWRPSRYAVGRVAAARGAFGRTAVWAYKHVWPRVRRD
ncbi:MAG: GNAT family N-acetyltransferase [Pirellulales bacterium]|nr:GNAT family N-acetyltransferase [Pirellulales bacterium]